MQQDNGQASDIILCARAVVNNQRLSSLEYGAISESNQAKSTAWPQKAVRFHQQMHKTTPMHELIAKP